MSTTAASPPRSSIVSVSPSSPRAPASSLKAQASAMQSSNSLASSLAAALVKEYLSAKGLEKTLEAFRLEFLQFQKAPLVSSRVELAKQLGIGKILNQNKASDQPLKSHLEVVVKSLSSKASSASKPRPSSASSDVWTPPTSGSQSPSKHSPPSIVTFNTPLGGFDARNPRAVPAGGSSPTQSGASTRVGSAATAHSGWATRTPGSAGSAAKRPSLPPSRTAPAWDAELSDQSPPVAAVSAPPARPRFADLEITDDVGFDDDDDDSEGGFGFRGTLGPTSCSKGSLITTQKALMLRRVTFAGGGGDEARVRTTFPDEWRGKGFVFNGAQMEIGYGLVQAKVGGYFVPYVIKHLAFGRDKSAIRDGKLRPTSLQSKVALVEAMVEILWQAGGTRHMRAIVALFKPNLRVNIKSDVSRERYVPDGITENLELHEFSDPNALRDFLTANLDSFMGNDPYKHGLIQLLYSAVLSRGPETVREDDFDEPECSLIGRHAYCTQELVNLLLTGQAISNVHDGDIHLGGAGDDAKVLKGIKKPQQFGYLTLFEHYESMKVGDYFKNPQLPIFVVCSESHFSVLFSLDDRLLATKPSKPGGKVFPGPRGFDVVYYDGLAGQDCEIRLEVRGKLGAGGASPGKNAQGNNYGLVPPLELVLGTRWEHFEVEWHGSEPLL
ncbi:hypothetical protein HDU96_003187 [Phlyctochytrium bullatum]|nr:hypothetical protein HDU96_003187 [Phlyctochytrium bullatum]